MKTIKEIVDSAHKGGFYKYFPPCDPEELAKAKPLTEEAKLRVDKFMEEFDKALSLE